ncbi:retrotransposon hot spot (RHS) protein, partial [Trypanosoma cruzi]
MPLHANTVLQRVRGMIRFVCTLILFAAFCGHARLKGGKMERGDAWPRLAQRSVHDFAVHIVVLPLRCDCGLLCGDGGGWRRVLARGGTVGSCLRFSLPSFCEGVHLFLLSGIGQ